jgi:hypothetical protein
MLQATTPPQLNEFEKSVRMRILHALTVFPKISHSMLQIAIGTGLPATLWKPILDELISAGTVKKYTEVVQSPYSHKAQSYTFLTLGDSNAVPDAN